MDQSCDLKIKAINRFKRIKMALVKKKQAINNRIN